MISKRAVVITEAEHDNDYVMQSDNEIVFVLPNNNRVAAARREPSRYGQIADGLYAERNLTLAATPFKVRRCISSFKAIRLAFCGKRS